MAVPRPSIGFENLWIGMGRNNANSAKPEEAALSVTNWVRRRETDIEENVREREAADNRNSCHYPILVKMRSRGRNIL